ncbi:hypothetical protein [Polynucleobacter antarcticus]
MQVFFSSLLVIVVLTSSNLSFAQAISNDFQKNCAREQLKEHRGIKGKALTESDFAEYCTCQAEFISNNATSQQINDLIKSPKIKPQWLITVEQKAMNFCVSSDSKMRT